MKFAYFLESQASRTQINGRHGSDDLRHCFSGRQLSDSRRGNQGTRV